MKKQGAFIFTFIFAIAFAAAQNYQLPKVPLNLKKNDNVPSVVDGQVIYAQSDSKKALKSDMDLPEELADGVVIISYRCEYYYLGQKKNGYYQMVYSNIKPDAKFLKASAENPIDVKESDIIGTAKENISIVIRSRSIDEHLTLSASAIPVQYNSFWYFGLESMMSSVMKYLLFQPLDSKQTSIPLPDGKEETLASISKNSGQSFISFPALQIKIKTVMNSQPVQRHNARTPEERSLYQNELSGMTIEATVKFDGVAMHFLFPEQFAGYFNQEYKTGEPIYLYGYIMYALDGEVYLYGRDFALSDPDESVNQKQNYAITYNRQLREQRNNELRAQGIDPEAGDYVDMTQKIPSGGYATYERFFVKDSTTGKFKENKSNIEVKYFDKNGRVVARMLLYDGTDMIRNTTTYKYDSKGRLIESSHYDSKMYQDNGWKVDPKRSRIFSKNVTTYKDTKEGSDAVTKTYRYSYLPRVERLDSQRFEKYNSDGILIRSETKNEESPDLIDIYEYDNFGNPTYINYTGEKPCETLYEYIYDGDKIISGTATDVKTGEVTKFTYEYDERGLRTKEIFSTYTNTYRYNNDGKLIELTRVNNSSGKVTSKHIYRYDKKTGITILHIDESDYGSWSSTRFWYTEFKKDGWEEDLDPYKLAEELEE